MPIVHRTSVAITRADLDAATGEAVVTASEAHYVNLAQHALSIWLPHYVAGKCSLRDYLAAVQQFAEEAGQAGDAVMAEAVRKVVSMPEPKRQKGARGGAHPDGMRFVAWMLVEHYKRLGHAAPADDTDGPAWGLAAAEMRRLGYAELSSGSVKGLWDRQQKAFR